MQKGDIRIARILWAKTNTGFKSPTIALFLEDGRHVAHVVPEGAVITIESETFTMFTQDLRSRGKKSINWELLQ